ncbi:helix-turn-helix domain-containing protein [Pedobacter nutrimenti]|uniref:helix-turn-helix domain-containing protein n=1 Tax=Pedobacter nutrimenti TaxID=1241337 RepID=UPI003977882B
MSGKKAYGLADKKGRGRKASLNDGQLEQLKKLILTESPQKHGYNGKKWTGPAITAWIERTFGVEYQAAQVYNPLDKIGVTFAKGKGFVEK